MAGISYLALDVDATKRLLPRLFKELTSLSGQHDDANVRTFLEQVLAVVVNDELGSIGIGLETKLLGDETQTDIWFVSAANVSIGLGWIEG
jgi:hypothetical protein